VGHVRGVSGDHPLLLISDPEANAALRKMGQLLYIMAVESDQWAGSDLCDEAARGRTLVQE
jgi:hypothetical protein